MSSVYSSNVSTNSHCSTASFPVGRCTSRMIVCLLALTHRKIGYHALQAHDTAKAALDQAKQLQQAAQASLRQPCFLQQPYWCDGASITAKDLEDWQKAGLPFRAVVLLKAPQESTPAQDTPPLLAGMPSCVTPRAAYHVLLVHQPAPSRPVCSKAFVHLHVLSVVLSSPLSGKHQYWYLLHAVYNDCRACLK